MLLTPLPISGPQGGQRAQKFRALLTVSVKVLPDFQELGCSQLGQVQVRGLLLRASHGEPLRSGDPKPLSAVTRCRLALVLALGLRATLPLYAARSCTASGRRKGARTLRESRRARRCTGGRRLLSARVPGDQKRVFSETPGCPLGTLQAFSWKWGEAAPAFLSLCPSRARAHPVSSITNK